MSDPPSQAPPPWWPFLLPLVASSWVRGLWAPDEPRYAEIAREAYEGSSLLVLHLCGAVYPDKPPLVYWLAGLFGWLSGWTELWMRVPSLAATAGSAWLVGRLARRWIGAREARWAPVIYLTFAMIAEIGGRLQLDPMLAFLCLAAVAAAPIGPDIDPRSAVRRALLAGLLAGFAALAKGPVAWVHVGFGLAVARFVFGRAGAGRLPLVGWIGAAFLALLPVLGWAISASLVEPALAEELFFKQHAGRVVSGERPHEGPFWKHVARLPYLLLPWTLFCAVGLGRALGSWRALRAPGPRDERGFVFAALWFLVLVLFFSAIPPKRDLYLLPAYAAAALIAAVELVRAEDRGRLAGWHGWTIPGIFAVAGLVLLLVPLGLPHFADEIPPEITGLAWRVPLVAIPFLAGAWFAFRAQRASRVTAWARSIAFGMAGAWVAVALLVFPVVDRVKSARALALELAARSERPETIPCVGVQPEGYRFYGRVPTVRGGLAEALAREGDFLALVREKDWPKLTDEQRAELVEVWRSRVGSRIVLVCGRR